MPSEQIKSMLKKHQYPLLNEDNFDDFINSQHECLLFFSENPQQYPESNDVAVILPEICKFYQQRLSIAFIDLPAQRIFQHRYGFREWPSLVFLRQANYLGVISRVQSWDEYINKINHILASEPTEAPKQKTVIPVIVEN